MIIRNLYPRVRRLMIEKPETRNNDGLLTALVDIDINPAVANMTYLEVMSNRAALGLPPCESTRRSRQKAQETTPGLASDRRIRKLREEMQEEMEEFARTTK